MSALYSEIANYARNQFLPKSNVLISGSKCEVLASLLRNFDVETCIDDMDLQNLLPAKANSFDAIITLFKFSDCKGYMEADKPLSNLILLLKEDGLLLICEYTGGNSVLNLSQFTNKFECHSCKQNGIGFGLKLIWEQSLHDSIYSKNDWNDHCWMLQKCRRAAQVDDDSMRILLDRKHYTEFNNRSLEWLYGPGFISIGGATQHAEFLDQLDLLPGETVLDIGCGLGGTSFQIAKDYGSYVTGIDLSSNMITGACDHACMRRDTRVKFMIIDITTYNFPPNSFDAIYCRDCLMHVHDKKSLFIKCYTWLKPGGRMLMTDYFTGENQLTDVYKEYIKDRKYNLLSLKAHKEAFLAAGFQIVETVDRTVDYRVVIFNEMQRAIDSKLEIMQMFSVQKFDHMISGWKTKIQYIDSGCHKYGVVKALKTGGQL